jgi:Flp pilus assembly protein CpaB
MGRRIFEAVIGIALLVIAFILAFLFQQSYKTGVEWQSLPVPVRDIPPYTMLSESMFEWKDFPRALTGGYANSLNQLVGRISVTLIPSGLPVPLKLVSSPESFRLADPSMEVVSIPISPSSAVGGHVRVGDRVNIYRIVPPGKDIIPIGSTRAISEPITLIAENIPVVLVLAGDGTPVDFSVSKSNGAAAILVLAVTPEQLESILNLIAETKASAMMWVTLAPL